MKKTMICINCPLGCNMEIQLDSTGAIQEIEGNGCKRGKEYAQREILNPCRTVCSTMRVKGGKVPLVSVKTASPVPKKKMKEVMNLINKTQVNAPVNIGDMLIADVSGTNVPLVATSSVDKEKDCR